jgi:ABC-type antimicrobial peptide transport system permease subunit
VLRLVIGRAVRLAAIGLAAGALAAFGLTRYLRSLLFEVTPTDPIVFAAVSGLLLAVAVAACLAPARRAVRVDPLTALRWE